jgi:hypothetical protein
MPETKLVRTMVGEWALLQLNANRVRLEHKDGASLLLSSPTRIQHCSMHGGFVVLLSGTPRSDLRDQISETRSPRSAPTSHLGEGTLMAAGTF